jgi:DNA mismatch endonuclease (patch repair protein)
MRANRPRDTGPELRLRSELHGRGLRFRVHRRPEADLRTRADVVFGPAKVAVYVDGCFWHSCPEHGVLPKSNGDWWRRKLHATGERDRRNDETLEERGWHVVRVWEHEDPRDAADRISGILARVRFSRARDPEQ